MACGMRLFTGKTPTRAKQALLPMREKVPALTSLLAGRCLYSPSANMKFNPPPRSMALLKRVDCSPTPRSLKAFVFQLNHDESNVADRTMTRGRTEPKIPLIPANPESFISSVNLSVTLVCHQDISWRVFRVSVRFYLRRGL